MFYTQTLRCPVCKLRIGERDSKDSFEGLCAECDFYFYYPPKLTKPTKCTSRKKRENTCNCTNCKDRDSFKP